MTSESKVPYKALLSQGETSEEDEAPPVDAYSTRNGKEGSKWNHIADLDEFFIAVYKYHQEHGFLAIVLTDVFELLQFMFVVLFGTFIVVCLRYDRLLSDDVEVDSLDDLFEPARLHDVSGVVVIILLIAMVFWIQQLVRAIIRGRRYWNIRSFYQEALGIAPSELRNFMWEDVLERLKVAQKHYKMNILKQDLTELDVHHRILRFTNYLVAMVNKSKLPCKLNIPFFGEKVFLPASLRFNYEMILFSGLWAPFDSPCHLNDQYKQRYKKDELAKKLEGRITIYAIINLLLAPIILLYHIMYSIFYCGGLIKRQPGALGIRRWTSYGRIYVRHFNELDHELNLRLNHAYLPATKYIDLFVSPIVVVIARNVAFVTGSLLAVLAVLTVVQERLVTADNILVWMSILGMTVWVCSVLLPDENSPWCPQKKMRDILEHIQYMPDHWKDRPHTDTVKNEFSQLFQFKLVGLIDELLSPVITPFVLYFKLRPMAYDIVSFLHDFTIDVSGVGDVCSFAEMNVRRHGSQDWLATNAANSHYQHLDLGKTELSLVYFQNKHPRWQPPEDGAAYLNNVKESMRGSKLASNEEESLNFMSIRPTNYRQQYGAQENSMQWSIWSVQPSEGTHGQPTSGMEDSQLNPLSLHKLHDQSRSVMNSITVSNPSDLMWDQYPSGPPALPTWTGAAQQPLLQSTDNLQLDAVTSNSPRDQNAS